LGCDSSPKGNEANDTETRAKEILDRSHPEIVDLLYRVPDLTEEERESLAEHWKWAMKMIENEREEKEKRKR